MYTMGVISLQRNVAAAVIEQLSAWGVKRIYGLVGDNIFHLLDALARQDRIAFYQVRHEESAALMASAQAKLTGELGVCLADGGPGSVHLLNGLADASTDRVPVLAVTGQVASRDIGTNAKQYIDQQTLFRPIAGHTATLSHPEGAAQVLESAFRAALTGRTVAHVCIPLDILAAPCSQAVIPRGPYLDTRPQSDSRVVDGALEIMGKSRRPVILAGAGARGAGEALSDLALRWGAAIVTTLAGTGVVDKTHPLYAGGLGHAGSPASSRLLGQSDLCLVAGANWWPKMYVPRDIPIIQTDICPANIGATMPVAYGLVGDAGDLIKELAGKIKSGPNPNWQNTIRGEITGWLQDLESEASAPGSPVHPAALVRAVENAVAGDAIICLDTGDHTVWFGRAFRPARQQVLVSGKWRTMGFATPAALAAGICRPGRQVLALAGDGGFAMTMAEFLTAVKYNLAVTLVVARNNSLAMEKNKMMAGGLIPAGTDLNNPDFAGYALNCGALGIRVDHTGDLDKALREALNSGRPALVEVVTADLPAPGTVMPG